jgi:hypothetical protein
MAVHHKKIGEKHHVTSHHGPGGNEKHHSVHGNAKAAHAHMGKAMGLDEGMTEESPDEAYGGTESPEEEAAESQQGGGIPGMA